MSGNFGYTQDMQLKNTETQQEEGFAMEPEMEIGGSIDPEPSQPRMFGGSVGSAELLWGWATERLSRRATIGSRRLVPLVSRTAARSGASGSTRPCISARVRLLHRTWRLSPPSRSTWRVEAKW